LQNAPEGLVVIVGEIKFALASGDDPPGAPVARAGCRYGVFFVVAALLLRQAALEIAERRAVPLVWEWPVLLYQTQSLLRFSG
jgi:hypothetical protein